MIAPRWQAERAARIHAGFKGVASAIEHEGARLIESLAQLAPQLDGMELAGGRTIKASLKNLTTLWYQWTAGGRKSSALIPKYKSPKHIKRMPDDLRAEVQRLASMPVGGRDKHANGIEAPGILKQLCSRWHRGEALPGIGTWQQWWQANHPSLPLPATPPAFPWSIKTIQRNRGTKLVQTMGNIGDAAANKHKPHMRRNYSNLRKCELYMLDDVRLDLVALDDLTGRVVEVTCYLCMEVSSRSIVGFVLKPAHAIKKEDVDELLAYCLQADGYGIGIGYTTHIWFERGTIACSEAAQLMLESGSEDGIKVHRTGMDGSVRWIGSAADKASGHAAGKAAIESFIRNLHRRLIHLPGQRGNKRENQPANLGVGDAEVADPSKSRRDTLRIEQERIAQFKLTALAKGQTADLKLTLLTVSKLQREVASAIKAYHGDRGHGMQGFHKITEAEIAPGHWQQVYQ